MATQNRLGHWPMASDSATIQIFLGALAEPAMVMRRGVVSHANDAARALLGSGIEHSDVRLAIRNPKALSHILPGKNGDLEVTGIGGFGRPWILSVRELGDERVLVRFIDKSAAAAAEKMRVDFVANASHELRTPLTAIVGYAETLADDDDLDRKMRVKFGQTIRSEARRMLRIIEDLMGLSRIEPRKSLGVKHLNATSSYPIPAPYQTYFPEGYQTPKPVQLAGRRFSIDVPLSDRKRPGRYGVSIWGIYPNTDDQLVMVSLRIVEVH